MIVYEATKEEFVPTLLKDLLVHLETDNVVLNVTLIRRDENGSPIFEELLEDFTNDRNAVVDRVLAKQEELFSTRSKYRTNASDIIWALPAL